ncbi:hypothetical protein DE146DRAFT_675450 [Phaeosphaeria sp. MPI-PUGE-AT-0046c]|nr:hypothetical protein DE146DRAFT_675450 [Phaeosphaeria sp. MPI-PUGE-AT-0046c]
MYTVYSTSHASSKFTRPTAIPSIFPWNAASSCSAPKSNPSGFPELPPTGRGAACMISNDVTVNDHAFWDLYTCCKGANITAMGDPNLCSAQCTVGKDQTWQDVGECLSKRVNVVLCKPRFEEIGSASSRASLSMSETRTSSVGASASGSESVSRNASGSGSVSPANGAGNVVGVIHVGGSKTGAVLFVMLALGSFAGMML